MTIEDAKQNLTRWQRWAAHTKARWPKGSPLANLADRRVLQAKLQLMDLQTYLQIQTPGKDTGAGLQ